MCLFFEHMRDYAFTADQRHSSTFLFSLIWSRKESPQSGFKGTALLQRDPSVVPTMFSFNILLPLADSKSEGFFLAFNCSRKDRPPLLTAAPSPPTPPRRPFSLGGECISNIFYKNRLK